VFAVSSAGSVYLLCRNPSNVVAAIRRASSLLTSFACLGSGAAVAAVTLLRLSRHQRGVPMRLMAPVVAAGLLWPISGDDAPRLSHLSKPRTFLTAGA
jgi:hypothetical protein